MRLVRHSCTRLAAACALWAATPVLLCAQGYPSKPVRIVTAQTGGATDLAVRQIAAGLTAAFNMQVIVDNRGGAAGGVAAMGVAKAPADGYTLLAYSSNVWLLPLLRRDTSFGLADFAPITLLASSPNVLVVHPSLPPRSVKELIAFAKARPGELSYSSGGSGSTLHMSAELFKSMAGINMLHVPYKSGGVGLIDLLGGRVQVMFPVAAAAMPHERSRRLRVLAVTSAEPSPFAPEFPTVAAAGLPGYSSELTVGMFAPAGTPAPVIERLSTELLRVLQQRETKDRLFEQGLQTLGTTPEQLLATINAETAKWGRVIREAGIKAE